MAAEADELKTKLRKATALMGWALRSESARSINAMLDLARSEPGIPILPGALDADPWLLNCANGTLDLRTGELRPHRRDDLLTKICPTAYEPDAPCREWAKFLRGIMCDDQALITFLQRLLGRCLSGDVSEDVFPIFWGRGANGKTTFINAVMETIGDDYAMKARAELLLTTRGERHPTEIAALFGRRLVVVSETPEARLNESLMKDLCGGERLQARRMREDFWEFAPTHKLVMLTNHKPKVTGTDAGAWRRLRLVPFQATYWNPDDHPDWQAEGLDPEKRQDKQLDAKLNAEAPGILAWLVRGCLDWRREGLTVPEQVRAATAEYRDSEDVLAQFIAERCVTGGTHLRAKLSALYANYRGWSEAAGERAMGSKAFSQSLTERKFERSLSNGTWYRGIELRRGEEATPGCERFDEV